LKKKDACEKKMLVMTIFYFLKTIQPQSLSFKKAFLIVIAFIVHFFFLCPNFFLLFFHKIELN